MTYYIRRKKIYLSQYPDWLFISEHPIPDDIKEYLCTDGNEVYQTAFKRYNKYGQLLSPYSDTRKVIAWMPIPETPKVKWNISTFYQNKINE